MKSNNKSKCLAITTCRVSTKEQENNGSLARQQKSVLAAAEKLGATIPEDGQWSCSVSSKSGRNVERKDILEMLDYCKKHPNVKYLIVDEPDRFMRSLDEAFYFEMTFKNLGVKVYYACDDKLNGDDAMAKFQRFMKYFEAEGSNEERARKAIGGNTAVLNNGLWPFAPKFGYQRGSIKCLLVPIPGVSDLLRSLLNDVADRVLTPTESLAKFNRSTYVKSGQYKPRKMDMWRNFLLDPFNCGILKVDKQVKVYNENGRHEPLTTKEQYRKIVNIIEGSKKKHGAPTAGGNPKYPMANITRCSACYAKDAADGRDERHNRGKLKGYDHSNGCGKVYERYSCRKCNHGILRAELHAQLQDILKNLELTPEALREVVNALGAIWERKKRDIKTELRNLGVRLLELKQRKGNLLSAASDCSDQVLKGEYESEVKKTMAEIEIMQTKYDMLQEDAEKDKIDFMTKAIASTVALSENIFNPDVVSLDSFRKCEKLIFPGGFEIDEKSTLHTPKISPFFRYSSEKKALIRANYSEVVHPARIELTSLVPETSVLSVELRVQTTYIYYTIKLRKK